MLKFAITCSSTNSKHNNINLKIDVIISNKIISLTMGSSDMKFLQYFKIWKQNISQFIEDWGDVTFLLLIPMFYL